MYFKTWLIYGIVRIKTSWTAAFGQRLRAPAGWLFVTDSEYPEYVPYIILLLFRIMKMSENL